MPSATDDDVIAVLRGLIGTGVRVAVGDFGLGNANLTTLRGLGFDAVKLDRSLTASVATNSTAASIVGALITIATELGLETTAEDIETADQLAALKRMGCHLGRGDHIAEPTTNPPDDRGSD
jgi:EAL domain-containing protein (putative c-di-GMP-specific phosphodiesterase class I)